MDLNPQSQEVSADPPTMDENPPENPALPHPGHTEGQWACTESCFAAPRPGAGRGSAAGGLENTDAVAVSYPHRFAGEDHTATCAICSQPFDSAIHQTL